MWCVKDQRTWVYKLLFPFNIPTTHPRNYRALQDWQENILVSPVLTPHSDQHWCVNLLEPLLRPYHPYRRWKGWAKSHQVKDPDTNRPRLTLCCCNYDCWQLPELTTVQKQSRNLTSWNVTDWMCTVKPMRQPLKMSTKFIRGINKRLFYWTELHMLPQMASVTLTVVCHHTSVSPATSINITDNIWTHAANIKANRGFLAVM